MTHLDALELRLSNERQRLERATTEHERKHRVTWVRIIEREIANERKFLKLKNDTEQLSIDELAAELESFK